MNGTSPHVKAAAALTLLCGLMGSATGALLLMSFEGGARLTGAGHVLAVSGGVGAGVGILFLLVSIPAVVSGAAVLRERPWGRAALLLASLPLCAAVPVGTVAGIYTLVALAAEELARLEPQPA